jgi:uncharacterized repeat protein (TIGR03803 family)
MMKAKLMLFLLSVPALCFAQTYTYSTLVSFPATSKQGPIGPQSLIIDSSGNLYGMSSTGGAFTLGTVFKVTPKGVLSVLHSFDDGMPSIPRKQPLSEFLAAKGFWVIYPRYRGAWESSGEFLAKSSHEDILLADL